MKLNYRVIGLEMTLCYFTKQVWKLLLLDSGAKNKFMFLGQGKKNCNACPYSMTFQCPCCYNIYPQSSIYWCWLVMLYVICLWIYAFRFSPPYPCFPFHLGVISPPEPAAFEFKGSKHYKESCVLYDIEFMSLLLIQHPTNMRVSSVAKDL